MLMMQDVKPIRTDEQHQAYLDEIQRLMAQNPKQGTVDGDRLELLTVVVESYENRKYPVEVPDPVNAILFRMEEKGLKQADLVPYFGTRSRVSEVLSRKRALTVPMIRALSVGLGISAETLIGVNESKASPASDSLDWSKFPAKEMIARGWIRKASGRSESDVSNPIQEFIGALGRDFGAAAFRRTLAGEAYSPTTKYALYAWIARVIQRAHKRRAHLGAFDQSVLSHEFLRELIQLSWFDQGPILAIEFLEKHGIAVVVEPHLKGTMLDGAALSDGDGHPVIGLTIRHDRLDNFWFTLVHEVVHVWKHILHADSFFLDDLDAPSEDRREAEANRITRDALVPRVQWKRSDAHSSPSKASIEQFAREIRVHPAIVAGKVRRELNNYDQFSDLIGMNVVRKLLADQISD